VSKQPLRVVVAGSPPPDLTASGLEDRVSIEQAHTDEELSSAVRHAQVLYSWKIPEIIPIETPDLRWIHLPSAGADHVRSLPVWDSDVILTASQGIHTVPMAEHIFAMLLALTRHIPDMVRAQEQRDWLSLASHVQMEELRGKTMGIIGWGKAGEGVAHLARGFGMRVIGTRWTILTPRESRGTGPAAYEDPPWLEPLDLPPDIVYPTAQTHDVLAQSDVVTVILPRTRDTENSFGDEEFRAMKRGALFLSIGRGQVVNEAALIRALRSGRLAGAGLDVFDQEPLSRTSPLWTTPNVIISPHVGGVGDHTRERGSWFFTVNLTRYVNGEELLNIVKRDLGY
jgi:phosphoglycerate dehydrogenase-like enzyme